jgi:hypothetical protein
MLVIRADQNEQLEVMAHGRFYARLMAWLRIHARPAAQMTNEDLLNLIGRQQERAAAHRITTERDLAKWCYLAVVTKERFDTLPEVDAVLRNPQHGTPSQRLDLLLNSFRNAAAERESGRTR